MANRSPKQSPNSETVSSQSSAINELPYNAAPDTFSIRDSIQTCPISSAHQTQTVSPEDTQSREQDVMTSHEKRERKNDETSSVTDITNTTYSVGVANLENACENTLPIRQPSKHVINSGEAMSSPSTTKNTRNVISDTSKEKSGAVSAPEEEIQNERNNPATGDNSADDYSPKEINLRESYDGTELLSEVQDHHVDNSRNSPCFSELEHLQDSRNTPKQIPNTKTQAYKAFHEGNRKLSFSKKSNKPNKRSIAHSLVYQNVSPVITYRTNVKTHARQHIHQTPKSPSPVLEVNERREAGRVSRAPSPSPGKNPGGKKSSRVQQRSPPTPVPEVASDNGPEVLEKDLIRRMDKERDDLFEALSDYYLKGQSAKVAGQPDPVQEVKGPKTYMSWLIRRKEGADEAGWNPMSNKLREATSTQVSTHSSHDNVHPMGREEDKVGDEVKDQLSSPGSQSQSINSENSDIAEAAKTMYSSLQSLQKAIHFSDCLSIHSDMPEVTLNDSLSQPSFQKFMKSENEIEVLKNMVAMLGATRRDVKTYLLTLQAANLVDGDNLGFKKSSLGAMTCASRGSKNANSTVVPCNQGKHQSKDSSLSCRSKLKEIPENVKLHGSLGTIQTKMQTFLAQDNIISLSTYFVPDTNSVVQLAHCDGHMYQTQFTASRASGPFLGITKSKKEYWGKPAPLSLDVVLNSIHRCAGYIDVRIACSCVWARQSKRYMLDFIEDYLDKRWRPGTELNRLKLFTMERALKKVNVFAGISKNICEDLVEIVNKLHFCMQKSRILLTEKLKEPDLTGFIQLSSTSSALWEDLKTQFSSAAMLMSPDVSEHDVHTKSASSVEKLYGKLETQMSFGSTCSTGENGVSVQILMEIVALATKDIDKTLALLDYYGKTIQMPSKKASRVVRYLQTTLSQMAFSKEVHFGSLVAMFLSAVDKLALFDELACEQKVDIQTKIHKMCLKIIRKLYDLRANLCMESSWSNNLAKNSYMKLKEINEIKRLKKLKKKDKGFNESIEFVRGSDGSLRASVC